MFNKKDSKVAELQAQLAEARAQLAEKHTQLEAANNRNQLLEAQIDLLKKSGNNVNNNINQIAAKFSMELAKLPPFRAKDTMFIHEKANYLFVLIKWFCIPVLKELKFDDLAERLGMIAEFLKKNDMIFLVCQHLRRALTDPVKDRDLQQAITQELSLFLDCDKEKKEVLEKYREAIITAEKTGHLIKYVESKYAEELQHEFTPDSPEKIAKWLEMMLDVGNLTACFVQDKQRDTDYSYRLKTIMRTQNKISHYGHKDYQCSDKQSDAVYDILQQLHDKFDINLANITMMVNNFDVCEEFHQNNPNTIYTMQGKEYMSKER